MVDIAIIGNRVSGLLSAAWLKLNHPDLDIVVFGPRGEHLPLVGESSVEATFSFFERLGLGEHLRTQHKPKYGLTFYYKLDPNDPADTRYSVHENQRRSRTVTANINREVFDRHLRATNHEKGVRFDERKVERIEVGRGGQRHRLHLEGGGEAVECRWLIDASGRSMLLARELGLMVKSDLPPRSSFWFRLADYDPATWLQGVQVQKPEQRDFDSFYCTHHFMGRGNWLWCIPIQSPEHERLISVGVTWRPDMVQDEIRGVDDMVAFVEKQHPSVARFIRSGRVVDTATYRNYLRASTRVYSPDRWFIVGDAAASVDPLYSTGMLFTTLAVQQVEAMIALDRRGRLDAELVDGMDACFRTNLRGLQSRIGRQYEVMDDPYQAHLMMHWDTAEYMYFYLPLLAGGYMWDRRQVTRFLAPELAARQAEEDRLRFELVAEASRRLGPRAAERIRYLYDKSTFYEFSIDDCDVTRAMSRGLRFRTGLRLAVLKDAGGRGALRHLGLLVNDVVGSVALRLLGERALRSGS